MRALLWVTVLAFAAWSGWWWFASDRARQGAEDWFAAQHAAGWQAERQQIAVAGFPNRIDLTITQPRLRTPDGDWGWQADFLQLFALSYKPWHLIAAPAARQQVLTPLGPLLVESQKLQSSLVLVPGPDLALERFQIAGEALAVSGPVQLGIGRLALATRPTPERALSHDIGLELTAITPPPALRSALPAGLLPPEIGLLRLDAALALTAPLDRHIAQTRPQPATLMLRELRLDWGTIALRATGELVPDAQGYAEGRIDLQLSGVHEVLELAQAIGLVTPETRPAWESVLGSLAPAGEALDLPLRLSGGLIQLGPMTLGPAPRLRG